MKTSKAQHRFDDPEHWLDRLFALRVEPARLVGLHLRLHRHQPRVGNRFGFLLLRRTKIVTPFVVAVFRGDRHVDVDAVGFQSLDRLGAAVAVIGQRGVRRAHLRIDAGEGRFQFARVAGAVCHVLAEDQLAPVGVDRDLGVVGLTVFGTSVFAHQPRIVVGQVGLVGRLGTHVFRRFWPGSTATAACFYIISDLIINRLFSQFLLEGEYVCRLSPVHLLTALILTLILSMLATTYAAFRVARIEPSEVIRDV